MSDQALSFIGRLDRREESIIMTQLQEQAFVQFVHGVYQQHSRWRKHPEEFSSDLGSLRAAFVAQWQLNQPVSGKGKKQMQGFMPK